MYIPKHYIMQDNESLEFMKKYSFATVINSKDGFPIATHLPIVTEKENNSIFLYSHFSKANEQWKELEKSKTLVIFSEPHAYISPQNYEKNENVPTWDYISVHAYGNGKILDKDNETYDMLDKMISFYEKNYLSQWSSLSKDYKNKMLNGIIGFRIEVTEIQGKKKLSQNRTEKEQDFIIKRFENSLISTEKDISEYIKKERT